MTGLRILESGSFPVNIVNAASAREKGPGRPPYWEMVFWWTRKPLASARAIILGALLDSGFDPDKFIRIIYPSYKSGGKFTKTPHYLNPGTRLLDAETRSRIQSVSILDPFAGFGSIPLEAIRLGVGRVVAVELLPTAVVFLRAVLEYPKWAVENKLEKELVKDVEKWGKWVVEELKRDPEVKELYDENVAVYIGTWELKCPFCGKYTPLVGNWWLARVKDKKGFKALAWMTPVRTEHGVEVRVVSIEDPDELARAKTITTGGRTVGVVIGDRELLVGDPALKGQPNIDARRQEVHCLYCHARIKGTGNAWLVKEAIKEWNKNLEEYLEGKIPIETLLNSKARPRILIKVKQANKNLEFHPANHEDNQRLWKALEKLRQIWRDPDIPTEPAPEYEGRSIWVVAYGFDKWFKLFNPRQLLTLVKFVKLIREAGRKIEDEKLKQGWDKQKAHKYAEAVTTYLAIALCKHANYNSIVTSVESTQKVVRESLGFRGIAMTWNWVEVYTVTDITGSFARSLRNVIEGLQYLVDAVSGSSCRVGVLLDDATVLGRLGEERFDLIVTDPPYRDDVPYAELSDFYYVWLKRVLSDSDGSMLKPRFHSDVFFPGGVEISTQWQWFAVREVSMSTGRCLHFKQARSEGECEKVFERLLVESFQAMVSRLKEDGLLVTYYAQSSPEAWVALVEAGLSSGLYPVSAFPVLTESEESVVARGKHAITASIVIAWRRVSERKPVDVAEKYDELVGEAVKALREVEDALSRSSSGFVSGMHGVTVYVMSFAKVLSILTRNGRPVKAGKELSSPDIVRLASEILASAYVREAGARLSDADSKFYYIAKRVFPRGEEGRRVAASSDLILLGYSIIPGSVDTGKTVDYFARKNLIKPYGREEEAEVASRKTYLLVEPVSSTDEADLAQVLKLHGVSPDNLSTVKSPVHALHLLMLYSLKPKDVFRKFYEKMYAWNPGLTIEAVELAKALTTVQGDPEAELAARVIEYIGVPDFKPRVRGGLLDYAKR